MANYIRKIFKNLKNNLIFLNYDIILYFNLNRMSHFQSFINFQFFATRNLTSLSRHFNLKTSTFILNNNINGNFKLSNIKLINSKLKYWLDDFFSGGKDEYSQYSLTMANCSTNLRLNLTNFF